MQRGPACATGQATAGSRRLHASAASRSVAPHTRTNAQARSTPALVRGTASTTAPPGAALQPLQQLPQLQGIYMSVSAGRLGTAQPPSRQFGKRPAVRRTLHFKKTGKNIYTGASAGRLGTAQPPGRQLGTAQLPAAHRWLWVAPYATSSTLSSCCTHPSRGLARWAISGQLAAGD